MNTNVEKLLTAFNKFPAHLTPKIIEATVSGALPGVPADEVATAFAAAVDEHIIELRISTAIALDHWQPVGLPN